MSDTPITDELIDHADALYPSYTGASQSKYFEHVHQHITPLARKFERENAALRAELKLLKGCE